MVSYSVSLAMVPWEFPLQKYRQISVHKYERLSKLLWIITTIATLPAGAYTRPNGGVNFVFVRQEENTRASRVRY